MMSQAAENSKLKEMDSDTMSRLVGPSTEAEVKIEGVPCRSLVDSGSQVTTVSHGFYLEHMSHLTLNLYSKGPAVKAVKVRICTCTRIQV